ncbi:MULTISPECIES: hypothetical protein [Kosakonia]|uniref:hypothetical protein n=1 Tax=Kosakonia TaxID=1330547 RepID=UPI0005EE50C4|nr:MULTISPECIES: hypothetical protein [Kosakonia]
MKTKEYFCKQTELSVEKIHDECRTKKTETGAEKRTVKIIAHHSGCIVLIQEGHAKKLKKSFG